jgi:uncharacterized protein DUF1461
VGVKKRRALCALAALFVPLILIGNAVQVVAHPWWPRVEIGLHNAGAALPEREQRRLADVALDSILPWGRGNSGLRDARRDDGTAAFDTRERHHLSSVRDYILGLYVIEAVGLVGIAVGLAFRRSRRFTKDALLAGVLLTLAIATFCLVYILVAPVSFLGGFHRVFFRGSSWRFEDTETLRIVFPDVFWSDTALVLGGLVALQAAAVLVWQRQAIRAWWRRPRHARP